MTGPAAGGSEPRLRVEVVVATLTADEPRLLRVLLESEDDLLRLPGDALHPDEDLDATARRVLTGVGLAEPKHLEQLASFGDPDRVPEARTVSITYLALVPQPFDPAPAGRWIDPVGWADQRVPLAADHGAIIDAAVERVRSKLSYSTIAFGLLPDAFTMSELQDVYEGALGTTLDKRNFRKKIRGLGVVAETGGQRRGPHRPAALYAFTSPQLVLLDDVIASA